MDDLSVDIHGTCVLRDTFELHEPLKKKIKVNKFVQNNPIIAVNKHSLYDIAGIQIPAEDFSASAPVWHRWFNIQASANLYQYLADNPSPYLLLTVVECLYPYYRFTNRDKTCIISSSHGITVNKIPEKYQVPGSSDPLKLEKDVIERSVADYATQITKIYDPSRIILVEYNFAHYYLVSTKTSHRLHYFDNISRYSIFENFLSTISEMLIRHIPQLRRIRLPEKLEADPAHRWGLGPQHFVKSVYDFLGRSLLRFLDSGVV